jgi:hypothetical protein
MGPTHARRTGALVPLAAALVLALYPASSSAPRASAARAELAVGATVLARAVIAAESSPAGLDITAADVARGYVDVRRATRLTIANTSPYGYALDVWPAAPVFREVEILGFGAEVRLGDDGGAIVARGARGSALPLVLDFRFTLAPGLAPGRYPWPLKFQVRPLTDP